MSPSMQSVGPFDPRPSTTRKAWPQAERAGQITVRGVGRSPVVCGGFMRSERAKRFRKHGRCLQLPKPSTVGRMILAGERCDCSLYRAKLTGRNRTVTESEIDGEIAAARSR